MYVMQLLRYMYERFNQVPIIREHRVFTASVVYALVRRAQCIEIVHGMMGNCILCFTLQK